jgi:hypothetical protein
MRKQSSIEFPKTAYYVPCTPECLNLRQREFAEVKKPIHRLRRRCSAEFSSPPARFVGLRGGGITWRLAVPLPKEQSIFDLHKPLAQALSSNRPRAVCWAFGEYEEPRSVLSMRFKILLTEQRCLNNGSNANGACLRFDKPSPFNLACQSVQTCRSIRVVYQVFHPGDAPQLTQANQCRAH